MKMKHIMVIVAAIAFTTILAEAKDGKGKGDKACDQVTEQKKDCAESCSKEETKKQKNKQQQKNQQKKKNKSASCPDCSE